MVYVISGLIFTAVAGYVLYPLLRRPPPTKTSDAKMNGAVGSLMEQRDAIYAALKELDFDFQTGKLSSEDYESLRQEYRQQAVAVLQQIDEVQKKGAVDFELEAEIQIARARLKRQDKKQTARSSASWTCPECGRTMKANDYFCSGCGAKKPQN
jgi:rubrerythrin